MAPAAKLLAASLLPLLASAHFKLNAPATIGFDDDKEDSGPCGGFTPDFSTNNVTDFHVGGEPVVLFLGHPQANWLFRATLDTTASSNWTQIFPIVQQSGLGDFCEPSITAPESWIGSQGVVGVVANAVDGLLFQCAAVNFVEGTGSATSDCKNSTVTASFVPDDQLSALVGSDSTSGGNSSATAATTTGASATQTTSPTASTSDNAAAGGMASMGQSALGSILTVAAMGLLGAAYVL